MGKVILYIATSQDGFIADKNGGIDWLPHPDDVSDASDEFGFQALMQQISTIVMGSRSYEQILGFGDWEWNDKMSYVFTSRPLLTDNPKIAFVHQSAKDFMTTFNDQNKDKNIWLLGGAELITSFAKDKLIDECVVTVIPKLLEEGIKLDLPYQDFCLMKTKECSDGMVQHFYERR